MPVDTRYLDWKVVYLEEQRRGSARADLSGILGRSTETTPRRFRRRYHVRDFLQGVRWNDQHGAYDASTDRPSRKLRP